MHTPGPWTAYKYGNSWFVGADAHDSGPIASVVTFTSQAEDTARLIAAAPKLLAALKLAASIIGDPNNAGMDQIHAAINEAEGRT